MDPIIALLRNLCSLSQEGYLETGRWEWRQITKLPNQRHKKSNGPRM